MEASSKNDSPQKKYREDWKQFDEANEKELETKLSCSSYNTRMVEVEKINEHLKSSSNHGVTGLQNLGNTCFMNSAIQCISNSIELTYFFLSNNYEKEINKSNKLGQKGRIAKSFYELVYNLWVNSKKSFSPSDFKSSIAKIASQFSGYSQHDSHELLTFLLDGLHEDLNNISEKKYKELKEKQENEKDFDAAKRFWEFHISRNNSIIVDLFHGQFKSTISCPTCKRVSITFDPFVTVSLPIPHLVSVEVYVVPSVNIKKCIKLAVFVSEEALFNDIASYINKQLDHKIEKFRCIVVKDHDILARVNPNENIYNSAKKNYVFCNEVNPIFNNFVEIYANIREEVDDHEDFYSYPRMFTVDPENKIKDLNIQIYGFLRKFTVLPKNDEFVSEYDKFVEEYTNNKKCDYQKFFDEMKKEYEYFFCNTDESSVKIREEMSSKFQFNVYVHNKEFKKYLFKPQNSEESKTEIFDQNENISVLTEILKKPGTRLIIEIRKNAEMDKIKVLNVCVNSVEKRDTKGVDLTDCLEHFRVTEKLRKNNEWYCSSCKSHVLAHKKMDIFYAPKLLIFHLKRFEIQSQGKYRSYSEKIDTKVKFPIDNLNLSNYIVGPKMASQNYELYAVSQHFGGTGGGHYTAAAKNFGKWYNFNDSSVSQIDETSIVSSSAYLLFYRRKEE